LETLVFGNFGFRDFRFRTCVLLKYPKCPFEHLRERKHVNKEVRV